MGHVDDALQIAHRVIPAYRDLGELAFAYGQGSAIAGFRSDATLDLVAVWDRVQPPDADVRPVDQLNEGDDLVVRLDHLGMVRDTFWSGGRKVAVSHLTMAEVKRWVDEVQSGRGWEHVLRPTPLYAVAGFVYGVQLADPEGSGTAWRDDLASFPDALVERSTDVLAEDLRTYRPELVRSARAGDAWLFHKTLSDLLRRALVAWFAVEHRYCPYPKWLRLWVARFGMDPSIAALERNMFAPPVGLDRRLELFEQMCQRILALR
jgi:hypothetical protein